MRKHIRKVLSLVCGRNQGRHFEAIDVVYEDDLMKVSVIEGKGEHCFLCFTGVGQTLGGLEVQKEEFKKINSNQGNIVFITDKRRSWGNLLDFEKLLQLILPFTDGKSIVTLGNSMGGFLAVLITRLTPCRSCIAFSPQFSVHPEIVPKETRWKSYTSGINSYKFVSLQDYFVEDCSYYCFFGDDKLEKIHSGLFPAGQNIHKFEFQNADHNLARHLKEKGILYDLIDAAASRAAVDNLVRPFSLQLH